MHSYPNCDGFNKIIKGPDVRQLAEICEKLGLDFQIVLLTRFPDSVLISTTVKRQMALDLEAQGPYYNTVLDILLGQLASLDPMFISGCINIESNKTEALRLASPLRQRIGLSKADLRQIFEHFSTKPRICIDETRMSNNWQAKMTEFYKKSVFLEQLCESAVTRIVTL